jgi:hypothetical protein
MSDENKNAWERWKDNLGETRPWDLIDPSIEKVSDEKAAERFSICQQCPELIKLSKQCKKCGCFMFAKTKLELATCPLGKW